MGPQGLAEFRLSPGIEDVNARNDILLFVSPNATTATNWGCYLRLQVLVAPTMSTGEL